MSTIPAEGTADPALKHIFNVERLRHIAEETSAVHADFDARRFLQLCKPGFEALSLMARLRRVTESLKPCLPEDFTQALAVLRALAPRLNSRFVTMILPDYVALYGTDRFDVSMDALAFFTRFGSSEFAVRVFLKQDLARGLATMERWSLDADEHVRRLASEGSRPRLPWSFRLQPLIDDPSPARPILENLRRDPSLYVRKSVANHLNDISKDHPAQAMDWMQAWPQDDARTAWIVRHALRTLIKKGDRRALGLVGAGEAAQVVVEGLSVSPPAITLGQRVTLSFALRSTSSQGQRLVVDYAVHYVKKSGAVSAKVFKLKTVDLPAGGRLDFSRGQNIQDFTTRVHHAGTHEIDVLVNGEVMARGRFELAL